MYKGDGIKVIHEENEKVTWFTRYGSCVTSFGFWARSSELWVVGSYDLRFRRYRLEVTSCWLQVMGY